jgi:hypothetical protein
MNLEAITIPRSGARQQAADYRRAARSFPEGSRQRAEFEDIARAYRLAAREDVPLIALTPTIREGGTIPRTLVVGKGREWERREQYLLPRLAVCRASAAFVYSRGVQDDGSIEYVDSLGRRFDYRSGQVRLDPGTFELPEGYEAGRDLVGSSASGWSAMVPIVPPKHRPRRASSLDAYLVLWEVEAWEWSSPPRPPYDPALLRRIGGDIFAVLATWDLTDLERLVLQGRRR